MRFRIFIPTIRKNQPGFLVPFGYGFGYEAVSGFGSYYFPIPFNLIARYIRRVRRWWAMKDYHEQKAKKKVD